MVDDLDDNKISSVQNFWSLGAVEASNSLTGIGREGGTEGHFVCCFATKIHNLNKFPSTLENFQGEMELWEFRSKKTH